jgi:hypothetical protein
MELILSLSILWSTWEYGSAPGCGYEYYRRGKMTMPGAAGDKTNMALPIEILS